MAIDRRSLRRVLIVDSSADAREVLRTVLRRPGVQILEADHGAEGLHMARECHPEVMVLDVDAIDPSDPAVCDDIDAQMLRDKTALLVLGSLRGWQPSSQSSEVVAKPYQYGPLVRRIEALLHAADAEADAKSIR